MISSDTRTSSLIITFMMVFIIDHYDHHISNHDDLKNLYISSSLSSHSTISQKPAHIILLANTDIVVLVLQMVVRFEVVEVVHLPGFKS